MQQPSLSWNREKIGTQKNEEKRNNTKIDLKRVIKSSEYLDLVSKFEFYADQTNNRWAFFSPGMLNSSFERDVDQIADDVVK